MEAMRAIAHGKPMLDEVMDKVNKQAYKVEFHRILFSIIASNGLKSLLLKPCSPERNSCCNQDLSTSGCS
jgi:hypothetical protein